MASNIGGGKAIKNEQGVPIWVRVGCKCATCKYLRALEKERKRTKK